MKTSVHSLWVHFTRSQDVPGEWVAHCLDLDVVTQGTSLDHAKQMLVEAVRMVVEDDLSNGLDPLGRESAPDECWAELFATQRYGVPMETVSEHEVFSVASQMRLEIRRAERAEPFPEPLLEDPSWWTAKKRGGGGSRSSSPHCST